MSEPMEPEDARESQEPPRGLQALPVVSVCICTYQRPYRLARLLRAIESQDTADLFTIQVVVVDNDPQRSARAALIGFSKRTSWPLVHDSLSPPNIAKARNLAVRMSQGDFIAMIDDDEVPSPAWLRKHFETLHRSQASGTLGPVLPRYESPPPPWVIRGGFCDRPRHLTGTSLSDPKRMRTGNVLIRRRSLRLEPGPFDPRLGRTGGEDVDFFRRRLTRGDVFVWCDEAVVFESVPAHRMTRSYFLKRALLRGSVNGERTSLLSWSTAKSVAAATLYSCLLPVLLAWRHDLFMQFLMRDCDHLGKIFALCGVKLIRQRQG